TSDLAVVQAKGVGDAFAGEFSFVSVDAASDGGVGRDGRVHPAVGDGETVAEGDVGQRVRGGSRNGAGHVADAIVHHVMHQKGRVVMRGGVGRFATAALVDGDVDERRARPH